MEPTDIVTATVEVAVDPATAFAIFTEEIGQWWRPGPLNWNDSKRAVGIRSEPGVGSRWIEVYDEATARASSGVGLRYGNRASTLSFCIETLATAQPYHPTSTLRLKSFCIILGPAI